VRILITGATGFAGGWLTEELAARRADAELFGMTHRTTDAPEGFPPITLRPADLADPESVRALVNEVEPDAVFHLAGFASGAGKDWERIFRTNLEGTVALLKSLADRGRPCRVLVASSGYVYGKTEPDRPARESDPLRPMNPYESSKAAVEVALRPLVAGSALSVTVVRSFNHTGPRQATEFVTPAFARQIAEIERGEAQILRHGNLDAARDFLDVRDVVRAYRLLALETEQEPWRVVNVCSGQGVVMRDILDILVRSATVPIRTEQDPNRLRPSDLPVNIGDPSLLKKLTGWQPTIPLETTLADTLEYWRERSQK
jgi:GDP-4-dehydro-6-deoxy-D-mannose reductase